MELASGGELFERISKRGSYTESDAADVILQITGALEFMHSHGVTHRDLKPENLLYTGPEDDAQIKITDFGCAPRPARPRALVLLVCCGCPCAVTRACGRHVADRRVPGPSRLASRRLAKLSKYADKHEVMKTAVGSPTYIAPEILAASGYGCEVDVWSLGVILYILLCGYPPFADDNLRKLFRKISEGKVQFHSPAWDTISRGGTHHSRARAATSAKRHCRHPSSPHPSPPVALRAHLSDAKSVVSSMLCVDPKVRATPSQLLANAWVRKETAPTEQLQQTIENIKKMERNWRLRKAARAVIATQRMTRSANAGQEEDGKTVSKRITEAVVVKVSLARSASAKLSHAVKSMMHAASPSASPIRSPKRAVMRSPWGPVRQTSRTNITPIAIDGLPRSDVVEEEEETEDAHSVQPTRMQSPSEPLQAKGSPMGASHPSALSQGGDCSPQERRDLSTPSELVVAHPSPTHSQGMAPPVES